MIVQPVSVGDIGAFLQMAIRAFESPIFLAFTLMIAFSVAIGIKRIFVD